MTDAYDLKPKHAGLLTALSLDSSASQQELAAKLGVAASLVVSLADHLEGLGAVLRVRDPNDRRRQVLSLTDHGRILLAQCTAAAVAFDHELATGLTAAQRADLHWTRASSAHRRACLSTTEPLAPNRFASLCHMTQR